MIAAGEPAPGFTLRNQDGEDVSLADFRGKKVLIVFYPFDFSSVCTDQLSSYKEIAPQLGEKNVEMVGISIDHPFAHKAFREKLGIDTTLLADFEPKGEVAKAYGSYVEQSRDGEPDPRPDRRGRRRRVDLRIAEPAAIPAAADHHRRARGRRRLALRGNSEAVASCSPPAAAVYPLSRKRTRVLNARWPQPVRPEVKN